MNKLFSFFVPKGRLTRFQFWPAYIFVTIITLFIGVALLNIIDLFDDYDSVYSILIASIILYALYFMGTYSLIVKRLHDVGKDGYEYLLYCVVATLSVPIILVLSYETFTVNASQEETYIFYFIFAPLNLLSLWLFITLCRDSQPGKNRYGWSEKYPFTFTKVPKAPISENVFYIIMGGVILAISLSYCSLNLFFIFIFLMSTTVLMSYAVYKQGGSAFKTACLIIALPIALRFIWTGTCMYLNYKALDVEQWVLLINRFNHYFNSVRSLIFILLAFFCSIRIIRQHNLAERISHLCIKLLSIGCLYIFLYGLMAGYNDGCMAVILQQHAFECTHQETYIRNVSIFLTYSTSAILPSIFSFFILALFYKFFNKIKLSVHLAIPAAIFCYYLVYFISLISYSVVYSHYAYRNIEIFINQNHTYAFISASLIYSSFVFTPKTLSAISTEEISAKKARIIHLILVALAVIGWLFILIFAPN